MMGGYKKRKRKVITSIMLEVTSSHQRHQGNTLVFGQNRYGQTGFYHRLSSQILKHYLKIAIVVMPFPVCHWLRGLGLLLSPDKSLCLVSWLVAGVKLGRRGFLPPPGVGVATTRPPNWSPSFSTKSTHWVFQGQTCPFCPAAYWVLGRNHSHCPLPILRTGEAKNQMYIVSPLNVSIDFIGKRKK